MIEPGKDRPSEVMLVEFGADGARLRFWLLDEGSAGAQAVAAAADSHGRLQQDDTQPNEAA